MQPQVKKLNGRSPVSAEVSESSKTSQMMIFDAKTHEKFLADTESDVSLLPRRPHHATNDPDNPALYAANGTKIATYETKLTQVTSGKRPGIS